MKAFSLLRMRNARSKKTRQIVMRAFVNPVSGGRLLAPAKRMPVKKESIGSNSGRFI